MNGFGIMWIVEVKVWLLKWIPLGSQSEEILWSLDRYGPITHQFLIEHAHSLDLDPAGFNDIVLIPHIIEVLVKELIKFLALQMKVDPNEFSGGTIGSWLINPIVSVPSHAASASVLWASASFDCFEWVFVIETLIFSEGQSLLNKILH